jgi:hypothetical protein
MDILSKLTDEMQGVLTQSADNKAIETGFVKRKRKITGSKFIQTLVFGWLDNPDATLEELTQTGVKVGLDISPQGLDKRFTKESSEFLYKVLEEVLKVTINTEPVGIPVLQRFKGVYLQDTSTVVLPDEFSGIWKGCGGSSPENTSSSVKLHFRLDISNGSLSGQLQSGREHDRSHELDKLPSGSLWLRDLGYSSLKEYSQLNIDGVYHLSKVKSSYGLYDEEGRKWDLVDFLEKHCKTDTDTLDRKVYLGFNERYECRMLAIRVPNSVAELRRGKLKSEAKKKGKKVSERSLRLASWTVLCTNIPYELLTLQEAMTLIRIRWQIELLFKLWKSEGHIDESRSQDSWRVLCELYAKLIGMVIHHWIMLTGTWQRPNRSIVKISREIRKHARELAKSFSSGTNERIYETLEEIQRCLSKVRGVSKRKTKPSAYQLLLGLTGNA